MPTKYDLQQQKRMDYQRVYEQYIQRLQDADTELDTGRTEQDIAAQAHILTTNELGYSLQDTGIGASKGLSQGGLKGMSGDMSDMLTGKKKMGFKLY